MVSRYISQAKNQLASDSQNPHQTPPGTRPFYYPSYTDLGHSRRWKHSALIDQTGAKCLQTSLAMNGASHRK